MSAASRPGPARRPTSVDEELRRVLPVVEELARQRRASSRSTRAAPSVARACLDAGARIVNDVSALRDDPALLPLIAERRVPVVLMHRRGRPENKYEGPAYRDVVEDVRDFLLERARAAEAAGVAHDDIAIDPGIGFGKSVRGEPRADRGRRHGSRRRGYPVLVGSSRKGFIGRLTGRQGAAAGAIRPRSGWPSRRRGWGAAILRVHDVAGTRQALAVWAAMR